MGPMQDMSPYAIPSITVSPPSSSRGGSFQKHGTSFDLEPIAESGSSTDSSQINLTPTNLPSPTHFLSSQYVSPPSTNGCGGGESPGHGDELDKLKSVATRLRLHTRRPSYVEWCENLSKIRDWNWSSQEVSCGNGDEDWRSFKKRRERVEEKMQWVRGELIEMKSQDHRLAIQLMRLRSEIQQLRLQKSCYEHQELIDTATECAEEDRDSQQQAALCDPPFRGNGVLLALEKPLKDVGVTRLNLIARRFSLC